MNKIEKTFREEFGDFYTMKVLPKEEVLKRLENLSVSEIIKSLIENHVGDETYALFNIGSGEIEVHSFLGNSYLQRSSHLLAIMSVKGSLEEHLSIEDFLSQDEMQSIKGDVWHHIRNLDDYEERLVDAHIFYSKPLDLEEIKERLDNIYEEAYV